MDKFFEAALEKGLSGAGITEDEARRFALLPDDAIYETLAVTDAIRRRHKGTEVNLCSIVNAKSGLCKEDCSFCSQSSHYATDAKQYPMAPPETIFAAAQRAAADGAREFSIVTSGTGVNAGKELDALSAALHSMKDGLDMERCASLGILKKESLEKLKAAGLQSYHHNLETSRSYFSKVCTTHAYDDDVEVVRQAKALGFYVCSGGVFGLGEAWDDRIELASTIKGLGVDSVPINFLNPRPGTPLSAARNLTPVECLKIVALFRLMLPTTDIVVCGGRQVNLRELQPLIFPAGANGMMIGNYLTTPGRPAQDDLQMIKDLGLRPRGAC